MVCEAVKLKMKTVFLPNFRPVVSCGDTTSSPTSTTEKYDRTYSSKLLYRSSRPDFLTPDEIHTLEDLGIRSIIDLRAPGEYRKANGPKTIDAYYHPVKVKLPSRRRYKLNEYVSYTKFFVRWKKPQVKRAGSKQKHFFMDFFKMNYIFAVFTRAPWYLMLYSLMFLIADIIMWTPGWKYFVRVFARNLLNPVGLLGQYKDMIEYSQPGICAALKLLCDKENLPAVINCAHGKDRTGIVSAMVLSVLGQSPEDIVHSYSQSRDQLEPMAARLQTEIVDRYHMAQSFTLSPPEVMRGLLNYIQEQYGSVTNYLEWIGFSAQEQERLRQNLRNPDEQELENSALNRDDEQQHAGTMNHATEETHAMKLDEPTGSIGENSQLP